MFCSHIIRTLKASSLAFITFFILSASGSAFGQSAPGYQAPDQPKPAEVSESTKAAQGKAPLSKIYGHLKVDSSRVRRLPELDASEKNKEWLEKRLRIGAIRPLDVPIDALNDSAFYRVAEGDVRVSAVVSKGALYTRVRFKGMQLPAGARVFVYSMSDPSEYYGPYEGRGLSEDGTFWTPPMKGDGVIIEYIAPNGTTSESPFKVSEVSHIYKDVFGTDGPAASCNLEVPAQWAEVAKSVGMLQFTTGGGEALCTGTLLNDNVADATPIPYLLTANHCISTQAEAQTLTVYWNYNQFDNPAIDTPTTHGSTLLVTGTASDFTLLRLTGSVPGGLFFSGWDATPVPVSTAGTGIHHPNGSHKRIDFVTSNSNCGVGLPGPCANFLAVTWNPNGGTTEGGSSGSGLWTGNGTPATSKLVGSLTGGDPGCTPNGQDFYGRFSVTYPHVAAFLEGTGCVTSLSPTSQGFSASGGSGFFFNVNAPGDCNWNATSTASFVTITSGSSGTGNGTVNFNVAANSSSQRTGQIVVGSQTFTITQSAGGACAPTPINIGETKNGTLTSGDCPLGDGSFYDAYSFNGTAGQQISIYMQGSFDTYLFLISPNGSTLTQDDDGGGGTNSRIPASPSNPTNPSPFITLPTTGSYTIYANSFNAGATGNYSLTLNGAVPATRLLTVASQNPASGVNITVTPNDNGGLGNGTTQFTRTYNHNTTVTLRAAGTTPEGNPFKRWLKNGSHFNSLLDAIVDMTSDTTMTAEYYIKPKIYGEENNPNAAAALNSVTFLRGPFQILDPHNFAADGHTRVIIFTNDLGLTNPPLNDAAVLRVEASGLALPIEAYGPLTGTPGLTGSYIVVRLPDGLPTNTSLQLVVWLFGINSDPKTLTIAP